MTMSGHRKNANSGSCRHSLISLVLRGVVMFLTTGVCLSAVEHAAAAALSMQWDPVTDDPRVAYYEVHVGEASGQYDTYVTADAYGAATNTATFPNLQSGLTYYFAVRAKDATGLLESTFSNEISATIPGALLTAAPVIYPSGGSFLIGQSVSMSSSTPGATVYFTTDGSDPTSASQIYLGPLQVASPLTLKGFATSPGLMDSVISSAVFTFAHSDSLVSDATWRATSIPTQTEQFDLTFTMIPSANNIDGVTGLSMVEATGYTDLAAIVRFNTQGYIDARNGGSYEAVNTLAYIAGIRYEVSMSINISTHIYSVTVTPAGGSIVVIADNHGFRTEQSSVTELGYLAYVTGGSATHSIEDIKLVDGTLGRPMNAAIVVP